MMSNFLNDNLLVFYMIAVTVRRRIFLFMPTKECSVFQTTHFLAIELKKIVPKTSPASLLLSRNWQ